MRTRNSTTAETRSERRFPWPPTARDWLPIAGTVAFAIGVLVRARYGLSQHHPRHHVVSDAANMMTTAAHFVDAGVAQTLPDTIWPPGTPAVVALLRSIDVTLGVAAWCQWAASCLLPLLVAHTAYLIAGRRVAWVALALASLHFGYVHYVGFLLSECLFQFAVALAVWLTVLALRACAWSDAKLPSLLLGIPVGAGWACAGLIRPNAPPVAALIGLGVIAYARWGSRSRAPLWMFLGAALTGAVLLLPAAQRCTSLKGGVCLVSSNLAMNVALGQAGPVRSLRFEDPKTGRWSSWSPPSLWQLRYSGSKTVPAEIYDTTGVLKWVAAQWLDDPVNSWVRATGNALDLFRFDYWPTRFGQWSRRDAAVAAQLFTLLVLLPGLLGAVRALGNVRTGQASAPSVVLLSGMVAVLLLAFLSQGEARYRIPFDVFWIVLAAAVWTKTDPAQPEVAGALPRRLARAGLVAGGAFAVGLVALTSAIALPSVALGKSFGADARIVPRAVQRLTADEVGERKADGHPWASDTQVFECEPDCQELRVEWPASQRARRVELSLDHNDAYRVSFYRGQAQVGFVDLPLQRSGAGLRRHSVPVAPEARGFDGLGIIPLYGDGHYSLGHVTPYPPGSR